MVRTSTLMRAQDEHEPWFMIAASKTISRQSSLTQAIKSIQQNANDIQKGFSNSLTYIDNQQFQFN